MSFPFFSVLPGHDLAYNEIVKPTRRWAFSYYFLYRWLPLLHPQQAMLVQVLRQSSWQHGKPTGRCQLANATLCRMMGWSPSSHKTLLAELERPLSGWFVRRQRTRKQHLTEGHAVEGAPRYRIMMDDPLTPRDQAALHSLLAAIQPATAYEAAEVLQQLARQRTRELWARLDEQPLPATLPASPATVKDVARAVWAHLPATALDASQPFAEMAEQCQLRITGAGYAHMELDYALRGWLPDLGISNTLLVIALRARCFHDPSTGETRDVVTVSRKELEEQLGIPTRTFRRMLRDEATHPLFHIAPAGGSADPATPRELPHRGNLSFTVAYPLLPIAPQDRVRYEALLLRGPDSEEALFSTSGQPTRLDAANPPSWLSSDIHERPANPAQSGQGTRLNQAKAASQPGSKRPRNPAQPSESGQPTRLKAAKEPTIQEATTSKKLYTNHQHPPLALGKEAAPSESSKIRALLEPFGIKGLARILQNPSLTLAEVNGWILRGKEQVEPAQMGGYLYLRLQAESEMAQSDPLPEMFRHAGAVEAREADLFEQWWLAERRDIPFADQGQRARYGAWLKVVKQEAGDPERPDYSPHACWRREMARARQG